MLWAKIMKFSGMLSSSTWISRINPQGFNQSFLGDTTLQNLKSEKTREISLVPLQRHKNLSDLFLLLPGQPQMSRKRLYLCSFINLSENDASRHFLVILVKWLP